MKEVVSLIIIILFSVEMMLQMSAALGLLPNVRVTNRLPYGRIYHKEEGSGNAINNKFGYYYPRSSFGQNSHRLVIIGDSFIQALQINPTDHLGIKLEELLNLDNSGHIPYETLAFGRSGYGPAQYLELLKFAHRNFQPHEVIICIFTGNDFRNVDVQVEYEYMHRPHRSPGKFIYYQINSDSTISIHPQSFQLFKSTQDDLDGSAFQGIDYLPSIIRSHIFTLSVLRNIKKGIQPNTKTNYIDTSEIEGAVDPIEQQLLSTGLSPFYFDTTMPEEAVRSFKIAEGILDLTVDFAEMNGIDLKIVSIPHFPSIFYDRFNNTQWSSRISKYDFLQPEHILTEYCSSRGIRFLPGGKLMKDAGLTTEKIQRLYCSNGSGHFSEAGHRWFADAIYKQFYR